LTANDAFEEVTGLGRKELIGKSFLELEFVPAEGKKLLLENRKKNAGFSVQENRVLLKSINYTSEAFYYKVNK